MRVFVTGASGFIGRAVVAELVEAGHEVAGMVRSPASADVVAALGATPSMGDLDDLDAIRAGAADADAVVHLANKHDWVNWAESNRAERAAVETIAEQLVGTDRPFVFASGLLGAIEGRPMAETDENPAFGPDSMRGGAENLALEYADRGVQVMPARFAPTVHGEGDHGFVAIIAQAARERGAVPYPGEGSNRWSAVHRSDAARLVRLALESPRAGAVLHAVGEEGIPVRVLAEALAVRLGLPAESVEPAQLAADIPFIGAALAREAGASSALTRERFGWAPTGPTLLEDIAAGHYDR